MQFPFKLNLHQVLTAYARTVHTLRARRVRRALVRVKLNPRFCIHRKTPSASDTITFTTKSVFNHSAYNNFQNFRLRWAFYIYCIMKLAISLYTQCVVFIEILPLPSDSNNLTFITNSLLGHSVCKYLRNFRLRQKSRMTFFSGLHETLYLHRHARNEGISGRGNYLEISYIK